MKELKSAIRMLQEKAATYMKLADALRHLDHFTRQPHRKSSAKRGGKRVISRAGRLAISRAQKKRWRAHRKANGVK